MVYRSLAQLAAYARHLGDLEGQTSIERHPDADVFAAVNRGVNAFHRLLVQYGGGARFLASVQIACDGVQSIFPMPADMYFLWSLDLGPNTLGRRDWLLPMDSLEAVHAANDQQDGYGELPRYRLLGTDMQLTPAPKQGQTIGVEYVRIAQNLNSSSEMVEVFEDYVATHAASKLVTKDRAWDVRDRMVQDLQELSQQIRVFARQGAQPERVRDVWSERMMQRRRRYWP